MCSLVLCPTADRAINYSASESGPTIPKCVTFQPAPRLHLPGLCHPITGAFAITTTARPNGPFFCFPFCLPLPIFLRDVPGVASDERSSISCKAKASHHHHNHSCPTTSFHPTRAHPITETVGKPSRSPLRLPPTSLSGPSPARNTRSSSSRSLFLCPAFAFNRHLMFSYALHHLLLLFTSTLLLLLCTFFLEKLWTAQTGRHQTNTNDSSLSTAREVVGRRKGGK